ncbi:hypothetical protein HK405_015835, partial [Cladochytrium tenue]
AATRRRWKQPTSGKTWRRVPAAWARAARVAARCARATVLGRPCTVGGGSDGGIDGELPGACGGSGKRSRGSQPGLAVPSVTGSVYIWRRAGRGCGGVRPPGGSGERDSVRICIAGGARGVLRGCQRPR